MTVVAALARHGIRVNRAGLLAIAVVLAAGIGAGLTSLEIGERTENAYPHYLRDAGVSQLVVNPSMTTDRTADLLRSIPGVHSISSDALLTAMPDVRATGGDLKDVSNFLQVRVSTDGRYVDQDRPSVHAGRMIRNGNEGFISDGAARSLGLKVGDNIPLLFFPSNADFTGAIDQILAQTLASVSVRIVGIGAFSDEVLPDDLFPRQKILVTPDVGARFDCVFKQPAADDPRGADELFAAAFPPHCSASYHYFSMRVDGGDAGAVKVADRISERFAAVNEQLPAALRQADVGYFLIPSFSADGAKRVAESLRPLVTSLRVFGLAAILVVLAVVLILVARQTRGREHEVAVWRSLGAGRSSRALAVAAPPALAIAVGLVLAVVITWFASSIGAIASAGAVDSGAGRALSSLVLIAAGAAAVGLAVILSIIAVVAATPATSPRRSRPFRARSNQPAITLGLRAARHGPSAMALLVGATIAVLAAAATLVFSRSLARFIDEPARFGWPYDVAVLVNAGYDKPNTKAIVAALDAPNSGVKAWGRAALAAGTSVNGSTVPFIGERDGFEAVAPTRVVRGRIPTANNEVALGQLTARDLHVSVGDKVTVGSHYGERKGTVTGLVVLPAVGALESDRTSLGTGLLLPPSFMDEMARGSEATLGMSGHDIADGLASFVVIDLDDGVDPAAWLRSHQAQMVEWDPFGAPPLSYAEPVRPPVVIDVAAMQRVPALLAGVLALAMSVSVFAGVAAGTRARRRELAVVRALGGSTRQIRASVRWHALAVVTTGIVVGLPLGIALGRAAYSSFARSIGATADPRVPLALVGALVIVALAVGLAAAAVPARRVSSHATVTEALHVDAAGTSA